jgi:hypothetical protein
MNACLIHSIHSNPTAVQVCDDVSAQAARPDLEALAATKARLAQLLAREEQVRGQVCRTDRTNIVWRSGCRTTAAPRCGLLCLARRRRAAESPYPWPGADLALKGAAAALSHVPCLTCRRCLSSRALCPGGGARRRARPPRQRRRAGRHGVCAGEMCEAAPGSRALLRSSLVVLRPRLVAAMDDFRTVQNGCG